MYLNAYIQNLVKNGPVVSEKSKPLFSYVNDLGLRSRNNLDLEYPYTLIHSICCLHLPHATIVSDISTIITFSYTKACDTKFDIAVKKVKVNPRS